MCVSVSVCVCEEDVHEKREKRKRLEREKKEKRVKKGKHKLVHSDKQTDTQTDG